MIYQANSPLWRLSGAPVEGIAICREALQISQLDYQVAKAPNRHHLPSGKIVSSKKSFFTYRTDTEEVLGSHVGHKYNVIQNADAFEFLDALIGKETGIKYDTVGILGSGERLFITAELPDYMRIGQSDDVIKKYLLLANSHDGSCAITLTPTDVRIACANVLNHMIRSSAHTFKIRHTLRADLNLKLAHEALGFSEKLSRLKQEQFTQWSKIRITDQELKKLIRLAMTSNPETIDKIRLEEEFKDSVYLNKLVDSVYSYAMTADSQQITTTKGTVFGAYNAVTGYFGNIKPYDSIGDKTKSILFGGDAYLKGQECYNLCADFAQFGPQALSVN